MNARNYMGKVRLLPCCVCEAFGEVQQSPTEAHHPCHDRFSNIRTSDFSTIPLCEGHHTGQFDTTKLAIHRAKEQWREKYGPDHDFIEATQDRVMEVI